MSVAHSIRIGTENRYDIVDVLEMEPLRRRMLVASLMIEKEDRDQRNGST